MNYNELILYSVLGSNGYNQYHKYKEAVRVAQAAQKEQERKERQKILKSIGSFLIRSIEPTAEYYKKWHDVDDSKYPNIERGFATVE